MSRNGLFMFTVLVLSCAATTAAQTAPPAPTQLAVDRIPSDFVVAPDFKATEVDDRFGQLAGAYAGVVLGDTLLVGGAGYRLINGSDDFELAYGGLLLGWNGLDVGRVRFGARSLLGAGSATLGRRVDVFFGRAGGREPMLRFGGRNNQRGVAFAEPSMIHRRISDQFLVFEPQANASFSLTERMAITGAAGYRAVALTDGLDELLDGPTLSLALQFGW